MRDVRPKIPLEGGMGQCSPPVPGEGSYVRLIRPRRGERVQAVALAARPEWYRVHYLLSTRESRGCIGPGCPWDATVGARPTGYLPACLWPSRVCVVLQISAHAHLCCRPLFSREDLLGRPVHLERGASRPNAAVVCEVGRLSHDLSLLPPPFAALPVLLRLWGYELRPSVSEMFPEVVPPMEDVH